MLRTALLSLLCIPCLLQAQADLKLYMPVSAAAGEIVQAKLTIFTRDIDGRLSLTQKFPPGILVNEQNSNGGLFAFSEQTLDLNWLNVQQNDSFQIEYSLFIPEVTSSEIRISSRVSGYAGSTLKQAELNDFVLQVSGGVKPPASTPPEARVAAQTQNSSAPPPAEKKPSQIEFSLQLGAYKNEVTPEVISGQTGIAAHEIRSSMHKGLYKYYYGHFSTKEEASAWLKGHPNLAGKAFVVAFSGNKRIELDEAIEKQKYEEE